MAGAGLPKNGRIGFELFDKTNFGITEFAEHVNYRRALEGELERSVMSVAEIEQARVHISLPQESVFTGSPPTGQSQRAGENPSWSVAARNAPFPAITNLVASAVEGLTPENVSVLDMRGNLLNRPQRMGAAADDSSSSALEYRHKVEQDLAAKLDSTLEPLIGAGRFRTAVSADCDITSGEQSEETFDPTQSVMVSSQKTEDVPSQAHPASGIPGTASQPSGYQPAAGSRRRDHVAQNREHQLSDRAYRQTDGAAAGRDSPALRLRAARSGRPLGRQRNQARAGSAHAGTAQGDS